MRISLVIFSSILLLSGCYRKGKPIKFEKIIFHTSMCFGDCPIYHLEVDSNKKLGNDIFGCTKINTYL